MLLSDVKTKKTTKTPAIRTPWSTDEKSAVLGYFSNHIKHGQAPRKHEAEECAKKFANVLSKRTWKDIKNCVHNQTKLVKNKLTKE